MDGNLARTYTLIHSFLVKQSHAKVAQALKKAAKDVVILRDDIDVEGPSLDVILMEWKADRAKEEAKSSSDSDTDSDSSESSGSTDSSESKSSSSDSGSTSSDSNSSDASAHDSSCKKYQAAKKNKPSPSKSMKAVKPSSSSDSPDSGSPSSSSGSESDDESSDVGSSTSKNGKETTTKTDDAAKPKADRQSSVTLTSGSASGPDSVGKGPEMKKKGKEISRQKSVKANEPRSNPSSTSSSSDDSPGSSSSSDSDDDTPGESKSLKARKVQSEKPATSSSTKPLIQKGAEVQSAKKPNAKAPKQPVVPDKKFKAKPPKQESEDLDEVQPIKKRRTSEKGTAVVTATQSVDTQAPDTQYGNVNGKKGKADRKITTPFQRVDPGKVPKHFIQDNGYTAKAGPANDYGHRAHQDLIVTRGAGFRKEKNKKKRGNYKGGEISLESHSFKFE